MSVNCNCEVNGTNSTRSMLSWTRLSKASAVPTNRGLALRVNSVVRPILDLDFAGGRVPHHCAFIAALPDAAARGMNHGLSGLAVEGLLELRHIPQHVVDAQLGHGVRIGQNHVPRRFRPDLIAPAHSVGDEVTDRKSVV